MRFLKSLFHIVTESFLNVSTRLFYDVFQKFPCGNNSNGTAEKNLHSHFCNSQPQKIEALEYYRKVAKFKLWFTDSTSQYGNCYKENVNSR